MAVIISFSVLVLLLVPNLACADRSVQSRNSPSDLFNGGFNLMNAPVVGRRGISEVWDDAVRLPAAGAGLGLGVCDTRTLALHDGRSQALQICCGVYTERLLQGLDLVISEARKNGIRLILCLTNNNKDIGGRPQYMRSPTDLDSAAFYSNRVVNSDFKKHVKWLLKRINTVTGVAYRDDPAIMGWKLIILQPHGGQVDHHLGKTLNEWFQDMASFVKSIDGNHLLGVGAEEIYFNRRSNMPQKKTSLIEDPHHQVGTDFIRNHLFIKEIDFITMPGYANFRLKSGEADSKPMNGGGKNFEQYFPNMIQSSDRVYNDDPYYFLTARFLLHHEESPPTSQVVVSDVKAVPPSKPSGCTKIPSNDTGHCPST